MSSNKKFLSILGFLGILVGLLFINIFFLKISKAIVDMSKPASTPIPSQALSEKSSEITSKEIPNLENKISESNKGKEIISNLAFYLDEVNNDKNYLNSKEQLQLQNKISSINNNDEVKQAAIQPMNFLETVNQESNFQKVNNETIAERYPDFPALDLDPPVKHKDNPAHIPIIERNISEAEETVKSENENKTANLNSTQIIINNDTDKNITGPIISENKATCVDVLQDNKNSTTIIISENRTIVIDLPKNEELKNTTSITDKADTNKTSEQKETNITKQDAIVIVHQNQTETKTLNASDSVIIKEEHSENVTVLNETYQASNETAVAAADDESCDFENEEAQESLNNTAVNITEAAEDIEKPNHKAEHHNKDKHYHHENKHKKAAEKHHRNDKHHGKRCRNKKHAHYIELAKGESSNLILESKNK